MKFLFTFRAKLILTISPIVASITTGALLLAERKFSVTHQKLFEEQFKTRSARSRRPRTSVLRPCHPCWRPSPESGASQ